MSQSNREFAESVLIAYREHLKGNRCISDFGWCLDRLEIVLGWKDKRAVEQRVKIERLEEGMAEIQKVCLIYPPQYRDKINLVCRMLLSNEDDSERET